MTKHSSGSRIPGFYNFDIEERLVEIAPAGNGVGLSIPMAVDAGLGQVGRMGLLMTPKYGPRVRIAKVITDMPLVPDRPISFGVTEFCEACGRCAEDCPGEAISAGERTTEPIDISNSPGINRWPVNVDRLIVVL